MISSKKINKTYRLCHGTTMEDIDGNIVLLKDNGDAVTMNDTAAEILKLVITKGTLPAGDILREKYDVDAINIGNDIDELTQELVRSDLIEPIASV